MVRPSADRILLVSGQRRRSGDLSVASRNGAPALRLVESRDPAGALARLSKERFDAVALELPPRKALDLASLVRKQHPGVIVILLVQTALAAGADAVISSPRHSAARLSLLEAAVQTLRRVALNRKLTREVWTTARSLVQAVRQSEQSREKRRDARDSSDPFLPS